MRTPREKARIAIVLLLFVTGFVFVGWAVIFYGAWFIPSRWLAYTALIPATLLGFYIGWRRPMTVGPRMPDSSIVRMGLSLFNSFIFWLIFAQAIPAAVTDVTGEEVETKDTVRAYYKSSYTQIRSCNYRLILREQNPVFGGYCLFKRDPDTYRATEEVRVNGKESPFGFFVKTIQPRG